MAAIWLGAKMGKPVTRDEAVRAIMNHCWVYTPKVFKTEEYFPGPEIDSIIRPPYDTHKDLVIAASYALMWLEDRGLTVGQLHEAWWAMVDWNNVFSVPYESLTWETLLLMMDKASYMAKVMAESHRDGSRLQ